MRRMQQVCTDTQIALEQQAHGVSLDEETTKLLDEHLPICAACGAFATTLEQTETVMHAHAEVLRREVDLNALGESAHGAIKKQKRSMVRGLIGLAGIVGLSVAVYADTGNAEILWPAFAITGIAALALVGDFARLKLTHRWAQEPLRLDPDAARKERKLAIFKLGGFAVLAFAPIPLPGAIGEAIQYGLGLIGLVGLFHYVFVVRALGREIRALRN